MREILNLSNAKEFLGLSNDSSKDFRIGLIVKDINIKFNDWLGLEAKTIDEQEVVINNVTYAGYKLLEFNFNIEQGIKSYSNSFESISYKEIGTEKIPDFIFHDIEKYLIGEYAPYSFLASDV